MIWIVFGQTLRHQFINYDDSAYVFANAKVASGLTLKGMTWAFTSVHSSNWHPLSWISHMVDCQIFGLRAGGHHFTNVLLHNVAVVLLFLLLRQLTGSLWPSAFVAALFAMHPLRVESVAWVAERKDILSGIFFMLTTAAYIRYVRTPSPGRYAWVILLFALGLMCKPMLVSLPIVLLLLDYWPLERFEKLTRAGRNKFEILRKLTLEKLPLFGLAFLSCVITVIAQRGAMKLIAPIPLSLRLANALVSYADYLRQMFWPTNLTVLYPWDPTRFGILNVIAAVVLLGGISLTVLLLRRRRYLVTGWLWYLLMLVPVIGILQVGKQSHADRYTYLPQIGIYLMLAWAVADLSMNWPKRSVWLGACASIVLMALIFVSHRQTAYWRNSETLWSHALACNSNNVDAEVLLAESYHAQGKPGEAMAHFEKALLIDPNQVQVHSSLGVYYLEAGRMNDSLEHLKRALEIQPDFGDAHYNIGNTYLAMGEVNEGLSHYRKAIEIDPNDIDATSSLAWVLATWPNAPVRDGTKAVELAERADAFTGHKSQMASTSLAAAYAETGRFPEAIKTAQRALDLALATRNTADADSIRSQLATYRSNRPFRDQRSSVSPR